MKYDIIIIDRGIVGLATGLRIKKHSPSLKVLILEKEYVVAQTLQRLVPQVRYEDLAAGCAGIRTQACDKYGGLEDDFLFVEDKYIINVLNAPSPAATASLAIGQSIAEKAIARSS